MNTLSRSRCIQSLRRMDKNFFSDYAGFQKLLENCSNIVALTGAGISAESGIPTFRGASGMWRKYPALDLATPNAFNSNPGLVWEFYQWRRETAFNAKPNNAHLALAKFEQKCKAQNKSFTVITQNVDGLHQRAGSDNVIEMHGSLGKIKCTKCGFVEIDIKIPVCEALRGRGDPNLKDENETYIPISDLPKCNKCKALARPYIVWFGELLEKHVMQRSRELTENCDLFLVIGTSSVVYPAAGMADMVSRRGQPVVEFNVNPEPNSPDFTYYFSGKCGFTLPKALNIDLSI